MSARHTSCLILPLCAILAAYLVAVPGHAQENDECANPEGWQPHPRQFDAILRNHRGWLDQWYSPNAPAHLKANLCNANLRRFRLSEADLFGANLSGADMIGADLNWAKLGRADLSGADLSGADLTWAGLSEADLIRANLRWADLINTQLASANLFQADLIGANLVEVNLIQADLSYADLSDADLRRSKLFSTNLENAKIAGADLTDAWYEAASAPAKGHLSGLQGLATVRFRTGNHSGLVLLRAALQEAGLREREREATFAIEHGKVLHARQSGSLAEQFGGWLQLISFEWTTGWGLYHGRALLIMLGLMVGMTVVYTVPIATPPAVASDRHGIFRVWPRERLKDGDAGITAAEDIRVDRLTAKMPNVIAWAFYFSMLSAFHIGWRDLNVGSWLTRLQHREYALRARGWVRFVSGLQSLISVYLLAMWALTYFGRPFQ